VSTKGKADLAGEGGHDSGLRPGRGIKERLDAACFLEEGGGESSIPLRYLINRSGGEGGNQPRKKKGDRSPVDERSTLKREEKKEGPSFVTS